MRHGISLRLLVLIGAGACSDTGDGSGEPLPQPYDEPCSDGSCQFVAPDGTGAVDCTPETPCSFPDLLVSERAAGQPSHIWLLPGAYDLPPEQNFSTTDKSLLEGRGVVIRGSLGVRRTVFKGMRFDGNIWCGGEDTVTLQEVFLIGSLSSGNPQENGYCDNVIDRSTVIADAFSSLFARSIGSSLIIGFRIQGRKPTIDRP